MLTIMVAAMWAAHVPSSFLPISGLVVARMLCPVNANYTSLFMLGNGCHEKLEIRPEWLKKDLLGNDL